MSLRQYVYSPHQIGLDAWPSGELRLQDIEITREPDLADVFVCPGSLSMFQVDGKLQLDRLYALPYLRGNESRSVFLDVSDNFKTPINLPIIFIRCDARSWMLPHDPGTIPVAWPVGNFSEVVEVPSSGFEFDVSCHHWKSTKARIDAADSCAKMAGLKCDIVQYSDFTGYLGTPSRHDYNPVEYGRRWNAYRLSLKRSRVALCGESIEGVLPYRFFEAMSAGRIPALVSSDFVLPGDINYGDFVIHIPRNEASRAGECIASWLSGRSDSEVIELGMMAREAWATKLDSTHWPRFHAELVTKKLEEMKAAA